MTAAWGTCGACHWWKKQQATLCADRGRGIMYCLNCGWCCEHLSPLTRDENVPCPHLIERDGMKLCSIYPERPQQCKDHDFPAKFCPVGMDVLGIGREEAAQRVQRNDWILYAGGIP
jgi:hypothetical protein